VHSSCRPQTVLKTAGPLFGAVRQRPLEFGPYGPESMTIRLCPPLAVVSAVSLAVVGAMGSLLTTPQRRASTGICADAQPASD